MYILDGKHAKNNHSSIQQNHQHLLLLLYTNRGILFQRNPQKLNKRIDGELD